MHDPMRFVHSLLVVPHYCHVLGPNGRIVSRVVVHSRKHGLVFHTGLKPLIRFFRFVTNGYAFDVHELDVDLYASVWACLIRCFSSRSRGGLLRLLSVLPAERVTVCKF